MQITKKFVCSSIRKFDENIQFCKESKIFLWVFRNWVMLLTFTIVSSVEILVSYFDESFQLWRAAAHFGFNSRCGLPRQLWSLTSTSGFDSRSGGISDFKLQGLWLLQSSPSGFDECFGLPSALRRVPSALTWRRTHWLRACAWTRRGQATSSSSAAALPMQLCCQWILLYRFSYCSCGNAEFCRQLALQQGIALVRWSSMPAEAGYQIDWPIITQFYLITTSLLTVITVKMALLLISLHHYYIFITYLYDCYKIIVICCYCNNSAAICRSFQVLQKAALLSSATCWFKPIKKEGTWHICMKKLWTQKITPTDSGSRALFVLDHSRANQSPFRYVLSCWCMDSTAWVKWIARPFLNDDPKESFFIYILLNFLSPTFCHFSPTPHHFFSEPPINFL